MELMRFLILMNIGVCLLMLGVHMGDGNYPAAGASVSGVIGWIMAIVYWHST